MRAVPRAAEGADDTGQGGHDPAGAQGRQEVPVPWAVRALRRGVRVVDGVGGHVEPPLRRLPQVRQGPRPQPLQLRGLVKIGLQISFRMQSMFVSPNDSVPFVAGLFSSDYFSQGGCVTCENSWSS